MDEDPNKINVRIDPRSGFEASACGPLGISAVVLLALAFLAFMLAAAEHWLGREPYQPPSTVEALPDPVQQKARQ